MERYFLCIGRMSKPVQMSALLIARDGCECSCLRIERMNVSPAAVCEFREFVLNRLRDSVEPRLITISDHVFAG